MAVPWPKAGLPFRFPIRSPGWFEQKVEDWTKALTAKALQPAHAQDRHDARRRAGHFQPARKLCAVRPRTTGRCVREPSGSTSARTAEVTRDCRRDRRRTTSTRSPASPAMSRPASRAAAGSPRHMPKPMGENRHDRRGAWRAHPFPDRPLGTPRPPRPIPWVSSTSARYDWSDELIAAVGLTRDQLPKLFRPGDVMGEVTAAAAKATGLKPGTPVIAGGGDGQCAGTGTNIFVKGRAYVNIGTACVSGSAGSRYAMPSAFRTLTTVAEDGYILRNRLRTGTFLINWTVETLFNVNPGSTPAHLQDARGRSGGRPCRRQRHRGRAALVGVDDALLGFDDARRHRRALRQSTAAAMSIAPLLEGVALEQAMMTNRSPRRRASPSIISSRSAAAPSRTSGARSSPMPRAAT